MFEIHPARIGYVSLNASDIQRSLEFYQSILGFSQIVEAMRFDIEEGNFSDALLEKIGIEDSKKDNNSST
jgi:catechol 2,3-dioxygenase-like lactoylglutathione lyase family enzyme